jgi:phospholipase/lecithinase/hemolysin
MANTSWRLWLERMTAISAIALLAACGSSSKYDEFIPSRIVSVGDQVSYLGSSTASPAYSDRFTVNNLAGEATVNHWVLQLAASYGLSTNLAAADPAIVATADPVLNKVANLAARLATVTPRSGDMLVVNGGMADLIALADEVANGTKTTAQALTAIASAGTELQALLLAQQSHYKNILVINAYDLKNSPYARTKTFAAGSTLTTATFQQLLYDMTRAFNTALIRNAGTFNSGTGIRLFDAETLFLNANLYNVGITAAGMSEGTCSSFSSTDSATRTACTTTAATAISSSYDTRLFADDKFPSPAAHRFLGSQAYAYLRGVKGW